MLICIFHGSRGSVKARVTQSRRKWYRMSNLRADARFMTEPHNNFHSRNGVSLFHKRVAVDRSDTRKRIRSFCVSPVTMSDWLSDECEVNLARESLSRSLLLTPSSLLCIGRSRDRNWNERMARGRVLSRGFSVWSPGGPFAIPAGFSFAAQLSIPSR